MGICISEFGAAVGIEISIPKYDRHFLEGWRILPSWNFGTNETDHFAMKKTPGTISLAGSHLREARQVCAFFNSREEECRMTLPFIFHDGEVDLDQRLMPLEQVFKGGESKGIA